ncbi:MAG: type IV secretion system DNA-binding domain-containing protein [Candidatus Vogelbacteria bacterium]|nr:type IV secretion system DNA-binding domain-containing protein [Candidatus Vogelbacteria bacterium]
MSFDQYLIYIYSAIGILALVLFVFWIFKRRSDYLSSLNMTLLLIRVQRVTEQKEEKDRDRDFFSRQINKTEQLFSALASIKEPFTFECSVHHTNELINFYLAVPISSVDFATRQIQGLFPDAKVEEVKDFNIFGHPSETSSAYLILRESFMLPLRTYKEAELDTFAPIVSTLSKLEEVGQGASIQIVMTPASRKTKDLVVKAIDKLKNGMKLKDVLRFGTFTTRAIIKDIYVAVKKFVLTSKSEGGGSPKVVDEEANKALQAKISKQLFRVNVRIVTSAQTKDLADDILLSIAGSFSQLSAPVRNELSVVKVSGRNLKRSLFDYSFRNYNPSQAMVLNTEEIASIFHLPTLSTDVPRITWLKTKEAPPPENLPKEGVALGESVFRGDRRLVRMTDEDRRRHLYIIGQTGTGKSRIMLNMAIQDMKAGKGVCMIDPHGELIEQVLQRIPKDRVNDVIIFDPGDLTRPLGLNMLEFDPAKPEQKSFIVNEIQAIFNKLFDKASMGPMFEQYMRNSLILLMEDSVNEPATFMEIPRLFSDDAYRERRLARITNPTVIDFWEKEAAKATGDWSLANMSVYVSSKFSNFLSNDYMRPIIGQVNSAFNFRKVMDEKKILLVNLSKGKIGDLNSNLLGMIIVGKILMAALSRVDTPDENDRKDFYLYMDEFQTISTDSIGVILSEARKYRLNLTLAHQFIAQLEDEVKDAVFGNVGSILAFRVGAPDTELLLKQFAPEFNDKDLIGIDNRNCIAKLLIQGQPSKPFNMVAETTQMGNPEIVDKLKELSRLTYGKDLREIEQDIFARLRL